MYCDDNHIDGNDYEEEELDSRKNQPEFSLLLTSHVQCKNLPWPLQGQHNSINMCPLPKQA